MGMSTRWGDKSQMKKFFHDNDLSQICEIQDVKYSDSDKEYDLI